MPLMGLGSTDYTSELTASSEAVWWSNKVELGGAVIEVGLERQFAILYGHETDHHPAEKKPRLENRNGKMGL